METTSRASFFGPLLLGVALYGLVEPLVFSRSGFGRLVAPSGSTGRVAEALRRGESRPDDAGTEILVLGDSRVAEGFSAGRASSPGMRFVNAAVPGSSLRIWRFLVRELDPDARRYQALVVPVLSFADHDLGDAEGADPAARDYDLRYCAPLLRLGDLAEYAGSFPTVESRVQAARGVLLRGFAYKHDFQALFTSPFERLRELRRPFAVYDRFAAEYDGRDELASAKDLATAKATVAATKSSPALAAYRETWFGALVEHCARGGCRIFVVQLPRGPVAGPRPPGDEDSVLRRFAARGNLTLLSADLLLDLEREDRFFDALHLNRAGRHELSERLARAVRDELAKGR